MSNFRKNNFKLSRGFTLNHSNRLGSGFTLIELLVVIASIGILSTIVMMNLSGSQKKARDARRSTDVNTLMTALGQYYQNEGAYPFCESTTGPSATCVIDDIGFPSALRPYLSNLPKDPQPNNPGYEYTRTSDKSYEIAVTKEVTGLCHAGVGTITSLVCK